MRSSSADVDQAHVSSSFDSQFVDPNWMSSWALIEHESSSSPFSEIKRGSW